MVRLGLTVQEKAQGDWVPCPRPHSKAGAERGPEPSSGSRSSALSRTRGAPAAEAPVTANAAAAFPLQPPSPGLSSSDLFRLSILIVPLREQVGEHHPIGQMGNRSRQGSNLARVSAQGSGSAGRRTQGCRPPATSPGGPRWGWVSKNKARLPGPTGGRAGTFRPSCFPSVSSGRRPGVGVGGRPLPAGLARSP